MFSQTKNSYYIRVIASVNSLYKYVTDLYKYVTVEERCICSFIAKVEITQWQIDIDDDLLQRALELTLHKYSY